MNSSNSRGSDDNLSIKQLLVKGRVLSLLIRGGHKGMSLILEPFADTELILGRPEELWDFSRVLLALLQTLSTNPLKRQGRMDHSHHKVPAVPSTRCALGVSKSKATASQIPSRAKKEGRRTCKREVAVSVRTPPPKHALAANGRGAHAALAESNEAAGRDRREMERANTIMIGMKKRWNMQLNL